MYNRECCDVSQHGMSNLTRRRTSGMSNYANKTHNVDLFIRNKQFRNLILPWYLRPLDDLLLHERL
jgi:hypothetical protein